MSFPDLLAPGVASHHRSLLVAPHRLAPESVDLLRKIVHTGARVLSFGGPLPPSVTTVEAVRLRLWRQPSTAPPAPRGAAVRTPQPSEWEQMSALHRACGVTVLPPSAREHPSWRHSFVQECSRAVVATASAQRVPDGLLGAGITTLVCGVAVLARARRCGLASSCVTGLLADASGRAAAITDSTDGVGLFGAMGWVGSDDVWLSRW
ncbi:hypothetical protein [Micromonospora sp. NPDC023644]|uniref:hypothetical protein n=1 Tax=Micromonospora sp. NPDC023644 TaxID=3154321 RepID=UPI0033C9AC19